MKELLTEQEVLSLLEELKSDESYLRTRAIRKIKDRMVSDKRIITELENIVAQDQSKYVKQDAKTALLAFGIDYSPPELLPEPASEQQDRPAGDDPLSPFSGRKMNRIFGFIFIWLVVNVFTYCVNFDKPFCGILIAVNVIMLIVFLLFIRHS